MCKKAFCILPGLFALLVIACTVSTSNSSNPDTTGPQLAADSLADTVVVDSVSITGTVSDPSGIHDMYAVAQDTAWGAISGGATWQVKVGLRTGLNSITLAAVDREDNVTQRTVSVYYKTNYFPIDSGAYWVFLFGSDTLDFKVDSAANVSPSTDYFRVTLRNKDWSLDSTLSLVRYKNVFLGSLLPDAIEAVANKDTFFLQEYLPAGASYKTITASFVGDTTFGTDSYRNCVKVTFPVAKQLVYIKHFYLVPGKGPVRIVTEDGKGYSLVSARYPGSGM